MHAEDTWRETVTVPILSLRPGESPRLEGEDKAHIARLAETETPLPPILVDRRSMRVIDGMHRLMAASLNGREAINIEFFDGSAADAFLRGVEANVTNGLPLSRADRRAAAARITTSHPHMSDRAIAVSAGLSAKTVASIRCRSTDAVPQLPCARWPGARAYRRQRCLPSASAWNAARSLHQHDPMRPVATAIPRRRTKRPRRNREGRHA